MATDDEVKLALPATPEFVRLARVTATGLASRLGFTYDEVEDLRLAIDELCFAVIGSKGRSGDLELRYTVLDKGLTIEGVAAFDTPVEITLSEFSEQILDALVDEHQLQTVDGKPGFRLRKSRAAT